MQSLDGSQSRQLYPLYSWDNVQAYPDCNDARLYSAEDAEMPAPTILPVCVAITALGRFGLLWLMKQRGR